MNKMLNQRHAGVGGLYFIFTNIICAVIMVVSLHLSWMSQAVAMADNLSYIVSINCTVYSYVGNIGDFEANNPNIQIKNGESYNPLEDFNRMLNDAGIANSGAESCYVKWDGKRTKVQMGEFETSLGSMVRPHEQESVIEDY